MTTTEHCTSKTGDLELLRNVLPTCRHHPASNSPDLCTNMKGSVYLFSRKSQPLLYSICPAFQDHRGDNLGLTCPVRADLHMRD
ncbi:hypothetical protein EYF80_003931 [Liparis tanakae]|uniref:Uncharacterized protein n=1 Tax=Liparis tanakae TaxID=230148 RepID=A0A4Z2J710_9TELE|nr:hypothetical protein EYF80_003931 [Liparis tanakae]